MDLAGWEARYRGGDSDLVPTPLLVRTVEELPVGRALDLACGAGRNSLYLARRGWQVTAIDGSATAIEILRNRAQQEGLAVETAVLDLAGHQYVPAEGSFDLVGVLYHLQRDLFEPAKSAVKPGGLFLCIVHVTENAESKAAHSLHPGELGRYFAGWEILHSFEGQPEDTSHRRPVAEMVARRPSGFE